METADFDRKTRIGLYVAMVLDECKKDYAATKAELKNRLHDAGMRGDIPMQVSLRPCYRRAASCCSREWRHGGPR